MTVVALEAPDANVGVNNADLEASRARLLRGQSYKDCSTVLVLPTIGSTLEGKVVDALWGLVTPMNQKFARTRVEGDEVGAAYNRAIRSVLDHPVLGTWRYVLTVEADNLPPPDGMLRLLESINLGYDAVSALYWTKGEAGYPLILGDPSVMPRNYYPQPPKPETVMPCNAIPMGFALWKLDMFRSGRIAEPWFETQSYQSEDGSWHTRTQDCSFAEKALAAGYRVAVDCRVRVGHLDASGSFGPKGVIW